MKTTIEKRSQTKSFLQNVSSVLKTWKLLNWTGPQVEILKQLKEYELFTMADAMQEMTYEEGDVICRQGDAGIRFFFLECWN